MKRLNTAFCKINLLYILIFSILSANDEILEAIDIGESVIRAKSDTFQSGKEINRQTLEANPSGNGDIGSALKILPNVAFDNAKNSSNTPGEIDPANISISGGLFYQNNFMLDGFNINNDINPNGISVFGSANHTVWGASASQGLSVDINLLDSIKVQDSNISAAYGGFSGGVVEANVRNPRSDRWHFGISYQYTSSKLMSYIIDENSYADFRDSTSEYYQPDFSKHIIRANIEGYISKNLGIIASYSTTRSYIPLLAYTSTLSAGKEAGGKKEQKRIIDNIYFKLNYHIADNFTLEGSFAYMPQDNTYFRPNVKDSFFDFRSGGYQSGLKALYENDLFFITAQIGYNFLESSRYSQANFWASWKYSADDKNWAYNPNATNKTLNQGGFGSMLQSNHNANAKLDFTFQPITYKIFTHNFRIGFEGGYQKAMRNRLDGYFVFSNYRLNGKTSYLEDLKGASCGVDSLGLESCSEATTYDNYQGQFFSQVRSHAPGKNTFSLLSYGIYAEDSINFDFKQGGNLTARVGLRFDGDNYMDKMTLAPRFALSYKTPIKSDYQTNITFGANRYYGRNLLSWRMYDSDNATQRLKYYYRDSASSPWIETQSGNAISDTIFTKLKIPFSDEFMAGIAQNLNFLTLSLKYIKRKGRDEIMRTRKDSTTPTPSGHSSTSWIYSNDGTSESDIYSITLENTKPIKTFNINHNYLLAFDVTNTKRGYNPLLLSQDYNEDYIDDKIVLYDGKLIAYRDRPIENYNRPYTIKLNTTHSFNVGKMRWLLNNLFSYRAGYEKIIYLSPPYSNATGTVTRPPSDGWNPNYKDIDQYAKAKIKGAFSWDMRVGFEIECYKEHILFVNVDIFNVLNSKIMATLGNGSANLDNFITQASYNPSIIYESGRSFWLQVGYKY